MKNTNFSQMRTDLKKYWVSTVELVDYPVETYETMVFRSFDDFDEVEAHRTNNETEAMQNHRRMVAKYCDNKEVLALAEKLNNANEVAQHFAGVEDAGTCNFDSLLINLKGKRKAFIETLKAAAGLDLRKCYQPCYSGYYFVGLNLKGQAHRRTKMVEEAYNFLHVQNVDCQVYYQVD